MPTELAGLRMLTKADIVGAADLADEVVPVPEWGENAAVRVLALDVNRRQAYFEFQSTVTRNGAQIRIETQPFSPRDAALAVLCIVDEQNQPMFTIGEVESLATKNPEVVGRIADVARRLSGLDVRAAEAQGADLKAATNGASPSDSPATSE
jgi:hypothetical protein